jgi:diphthine synthase
MLYLIGLGLDRKDISLRALEAIKKCRAVYLDVYTNIFHYKISDIERIIGKKIIKAERALIEESDEIIESAKKQDAALLVSGDPLAATTHIDLMLRAKKKRIPVKIIHAPSIFTAVSETGLQLYKFGKTASIPKWSESFKPESFLDIIENNLKIKAHTLVLIDIGMSVNEALNQLSDAGRKRNVRLKEIIVCERIGTDEGRISRGSVEKLMKKKFRLPVCIIIPGELHFIEDESLRLFKKA